MLKTDYFNQYSTPALPEFIDGAIRRFQARYRVFLTIHAMTGRWYSADDQFLFLHWGSHHSDFCQWNRSRQRNFNKSCLDDCGAAVEAESLRSGRPFCHSCWKGVKELVVPFLWNDVLELIFYVGPFRGEPPPEASLLKSWEHLPPFPESMQAELTEECLLLGMAFYMRLLQENQQEKHPANRKETIREYLLRHACGRVSLAGLSRHLGISSSRTSHLCLKLLGTPFQQLVLNVRMKQAAQLLSGTNEPVKGIAEKSGFSNVYYFSRMFRKFYGIPPARFRRESSNAEGSEKNGSKKPSLSIPLRTSGDQWNP